MQLREITKSTSVNYFTVASPMVGTLSRAPAPNEPSFVRLYDIVQPKQTVCIVEEVNPMNEIESKANRKVVEILLQDGDVVDCGQV